MISRTICSSKKSVTVATVALAFGLIPAALGAQGLPDVPRRPITDNAKIYNPYYFDSTEYEIRRWEAATHHSVLIWTEAVVPPGTDADAWSRTLFDHWREQRPNLDDGLALFVFTADKQVRLHVGPTLAATLPEGAVARVDHVIDDVRSQEKDPTDWDNPIVWTIYSLSYLQGWLGKIPPEPLPEIFQETDRRAKMTLWESLASDWEKDPGSVFLLAAIVFGAVILFVTHPLLTLGYVCLGFAGQVLGGVGGAAGKIAGGLFSGGGGSSGGGGASGSW